MNLSYTPRPWLYIAGPYSADTIELIQKNIDAARSAARDAWTLGWYAYCPHLNTAHFDDLDVPYQVWIAAGLCERSNRGESVSNDCDPIWRKCIKKTITVNVRWFDGYLESFECAEVRFGCDLLWMRLIDQKNRHIPLRQVRWFSLTPESHEGQP